MTSIIITDGQAISAALHRLPEQSASDFEDAVERTASALRNSTTRELHIKHADGKPYTRTSERLYFGAIWDSRTVAQLAFQNERIFIRKALAEAAVREAINGAGEVQNPLSERYITDCILAVNFEEKP